MKLSAAHFQHLENSVEDAIVDARALGLTALHGYGLLPDSPFNLQNAQGTSTQYVKVILNACRAVLPGGGRVEILPDTMQHLQVPASPPFVEFIPTQGIRYHIFLVLNPNRRVPAGPPENRPIRLPYLAPEYLMECLPTDKLNAVPRNGLNRMKIAEWQDGKILEGYIPPVLAIRGHPLTEKWHQFFLLQLDNIARIGIQVVHQHRVKDPARATFCLEVVKHIRSTQAYYRWILPNQSPFFLFTYYGDLAGLIESLIETGDRDFVRNTLKDGQINNLRQNIHTILKIKSISLEETAPVLSLFQKFGEAVVLTFQNLVTEQIHAVRGGDRNNPV